MGFRRLQKWVLHLTNGHTKGQEAIKSFIEYTKQNLPLIGQIFGNTFKGIFNLMKAFAPNTHSILESLAQMSEKFVLGVLR